MEEKVQVQAVPDADTNPQSQETAVLEQAVENGEVDKSFGLQDDGVYKVNLDEPAKTEKNAVQGETTDSVQDTGKQSTESGEEAKVALRDEPNQKDEITENKEEVLEESDSPLELIKDDEVEETIETVTSVKEDELVKENQVLPENIDKLVKFMEDTGGTVEDYVNLNRDVSKMDNTSLLREYYKKTKPHLDTDDIDFLFNKNFAYNGDEDDPQDIKAKQLAFKEELFNAQNHFNSSKKEYYADLKLRKQNDIPKEQQEAVEHYDTFKKQQAEGEVKIEKFKLNTDKVFNKDFKGFDFKVGENKYRYKVENPQKVKESQYSINNWISTHLDDEGQVKDVLKYHKSLFTAKNADKIAGHFYEQGRADAIRESAKKAKNINMDPRKDNSSIPKSNTSGVRAISNDNDNPNKLRMKKWK